MDEFFLVKSVADVASLLGLAGCILGFYFTLREARNAKAAAEQARDAVANVRRDLGKFDIISALSQTMSSMDEIKVLQRSGAWELLPDRYSSLRKSIVLIRQSDIVITPTHRKALQGAIQLFAGIENEIEIALHSQSPLADVPRYNRILSEQIQRLQEVLLHIRAQIGINHELPKVRKSS